MACPESQISRLPASAAHINTVQPWSSLRSLAKPTPKLGRSESTLVPKIPCPKIDTFDAPKWMYLSCFNLPWLVGRWNLMTCWIILAHTDKMGRTHLTYPHSHICKSSLKTNRNHRAGHCHTLPNLQLSTVDGLWISIVSLLFHIHKRLIIIIVHLSLLASEYNSYTLGTVSLLPANELLRKHLRLSKAARPLLHHSQLSSSAAPRIVIESRWQCLWKILNIRFTTVFQHPNRCEFVQVFKTLQ